MDGGESRGRTFSASSSAGPPAGQVGLTAPEISLSVSLFMDVHVPLAITDGLRRRGVDVLTAQEDAAATLADSELLERASALGRVTSCKNMR